MNIYKVQQMATVWYEVVVEAKDKDEAEFIGLESLANGNGYEVENSFEFQDEVWVGE